MKTNKKLENTKEVFKILSKYKKDIAAINLFSFGTYTQYESAGDTIYVELFDGNGEIFYVNSNSILFDEEYVYDIDSNTIDDISNDDYDNIAKLLEPFVKMYNIKRTSGQNYAWLLNNDNEVIFRHSRFTI